MSKQSLWIFKKIDDSQLITVQGDDSAHHLANVFKGLEPGRWGIKSIEASRFQLVENWIFERSEDSRADSLMPEASLPESKLSLSLSESLFDVPGLSLPPIVAPTKPMAKSMPLPPPPKVSAPAKVEAQTAVSRFSGEGVSLKFSREGLSNSKSKSENRKHVRVNGRLRIMLISGNKSFRTHSKNLSKGGLLLENKIPKEFVGEACRVIIGSPDLKENLEFQARVLVKNEQPASLEFTESKAAFMEKFESWMLLLKAARQAA